MGNIDILAKLEEYSKAGYVPMHMPGGKRNTEYASTSELDITEIDGFDNMHNADGIIKNASDRAAKLYGADKTLMLVNGSTAGILSAICGATKRKGKIIVARNCHVSVYNALIIAQLEPVYVIPEVDESTGIYRGLTLEQVRKCVESNRDAQAVIITSPTYEGVVSEVREIVSYLHEMKIPLIVDEAHGAHFQFSNYFPTSAVELGADLVIQSFHKTLPAMTQTAILHNCSGRVDGRLIRRFMGIYQTSSPSYILMASIDACMDTMAAEGHEMFREFTKMLEQARKRLSQCRYICLADPEKDVNGVFDYDRSKLIFSTVNSTLTGAQLYDILLERYHIQMEMETETYALALAAVGDREEGFERLCQAIEEIDREEEQKVKKLDLTGMEEREMDAKAMHCVLNQVLSVSEAMETESESCILEECIGRISAEFAYLYPPGIPLLTPGEQITGKFIRNIKIYTEEGLYLQGLEDYTNQSIRVVKQTTKEQYEETNG